VSDQEHAPRTADSKARPTRIDGLPGPGAFVRCVVGGALMGLANLVPGISGGTMLVASGVYQRFIDAISDVTRLRLGVGPVSTLMLVAGSALIAIVLLAGVISDAMAEARWAMYSVFIGLTLGGLPLLLRMASPRTISVWIGAGLGAAVMVGLAFVQATAGGADATVAGSSWGLLLVAGIAGASAMILPGVSGAYLLLLLGQYRPILESIDRVKAAIQASDAARVVAEWVTVVPVGIGVVVGVVVVSNALRVVLHRYEKPTLGVLIGLLVGAPAGLYPFKAGVEPEIGMVVDGTEVIPETIESVREDPKSWPERAFTPSLGQIAGSFGLVASGFGATLLLSKLGGSGARRSEHEDRPTSDEG